MFFNRRCLNQYEPGWSIPAYIGSDIGRFTHKNTYKNTYKNTNWLKSSLVYGTNSFWICLPRHWLPVSILTRFWLDYDSILTWFWVLLQSLLNRNRVLTDSSSSCLLISLLATFHSVFVLQPIFARLFLFVLSNLLRILLYTKSVLSQFWVGFESLSNHNWLSWLRSRFVYNLFGCFTLLDGASV